MDNIMNLQFIFSTGLQAAADIDPDTFSPSLATPQEYGPLLQESVGVVNVTADPPVGQLSPDLMVAGSMNHIVPPFQSFVDGHATERLTTSGFSARRYPHLCLSIVLGGQERVKCTWPGYSSILKKDSHTRHVDNIHFRKVKAICTRCEREFTRKYAKRSTNLRVFVHTPNVNDELTRSHLC